jgi:regulator of cell morphogenesis and NO signaling
MTRIIGTPPSACDGSRIEEADMTTAVSTETHRILDLCSLPPDERPARVLEAFDRLSPGEKLTLVGTDWRGDVLRRLQSERRGLFEWSVLASQPGERRIDLARRSEEAPLRGVNEALSWDHDRLDALENDAFASRAAGDFRRAAELYSEFASGLRRHIGFEEEILFPAFEDRAGFPAAAGPTAVMRTEHRQIEELLARIEDRMSDPEASVDPLRHRFHAVLGDHNFKEEQVLYPTTDQVLGEKEADALVARIQRYGE